MICITVAIKVVVVVVVVGCTLENEAMKYVDILMDRINNVTIIYMNRIINVILFSSTLNSAASCVTC